MGTQLYPIEIFMIACWVVGFIAIISLLIKIVQNKKLIKIK